MQTKNAKLLYRISAIFLGIFVFICALLISLLIADAACERNARVTPSYAREDVTPLLNKSGNWTEEEIRFLYRQTGLGKAALLQMKSEIIFDNGKIVSLPERILPFQDALFYKGERSHENVANVSKRDLVKNFKAPVAPVMQAGDVFVNSSTHTLGFRNGHAALVLDRYGTVLESFEYGLDSSITANAHQWFAQSSNFILLRLKNVDKETREKIALDAKNQLLGIPYSIAVGVFSKKDQNVSPKSTHCSHLVWQAYKNAGHDIDSNGGLVVTPRDIARSPLFEVVQVYGFDPETLW